MTNERSAVVLQDHLPSEDSEAESTSSNSIPFTSQHFMRDQRVTDMWMEITGSIMGPIEANTLYEEYLPLPPGSPKLPWKPEEVHHFNAIAEAEREVDMYGLIISALQQFSTHYELVDTHNDEAEIFNKKLIKPDITQYRIGSARKRVNDITMATMYLEGKFSERDDPFDDDAPEFEQDTPCARDTLGQLTTYASAQQAAQFRTHVFQVLFFPTFARILRWDRSGVVVTKRIPLNVPSFAEFFWRYDHAKPAQCGHDISVSLYPGSLDIRSKLGLSGSEDLFRMSIGVQDYVVGKATYQDATSVVGRSTRSFKAYSIADSSLVCLKDTWRVDDFEREDLIYEDLWKAKVPHILKVHAADDIMNQTTQMMHVVAAFKGKGPNRRKALRTLRHYRIAFVTIGRNVTSFNHTRELVKAIRDAVEAHTCAYFDAGILHCDISVGNILIGPDNNGLLIDWDLCKRVKNSGENGKELGRIGTWQFMSAHLLNDPHATSTREDDLEAFLHVLTWVALQYTAHGLDAHAVGTAINQLFNERSLGSEGVVGGNIKRLDLGTGNASGIVKRAQFQNPPLTRLFGHLRATLAARYAQPATPAVKEYQAIEEKNEKIRKVRTGVLPKELMDTLPKELMDTLPKDAIVKLLNKFMLSPLGLEHHPVKMYNTALANLKTREWPANVFDKELDSQDWHVNGEPVIRDIFVPARSLGNKRKTQSDFEQQGYPKQMRTFSPNPISEEAEHVSAVDSTGNLDTKTVVGEEPKEEAEEEHNAELEAMYAALREEYAGDDYVYERVSEYESESEDEF